MPHHERSWVEGMSIDAGGADEESPYSEAALGLLMQADGSMPDAILKLEPATVNTVCNDIIETSSAIQWDDIAGALVQLSNSYRCSAVESFPMSAPCHVHGNFPA
jgi:hypothetical protein